MDLTQTINTLSGALEINCVNSSSSNSPTNSSGSPCSFSQQVLRGLFGSQGLSLSGCTFGECVAQSVIDTAAASNTTTGATSGTQLSGGVIAGLAVVGVIIAVLLAVLIFGKVSQRRATTRGPSMVRRGGIGVRWENVGYIAPVTGNMSWFRNSNSRDAEHGEKKTTGGKVILDALGSRGIVRPGEMLAILGPSGEHHLLHPMSEGIYYPRRQVQERRPSWTSLQESPRSEK